MTYYFIQEDIYHRADMNKRRERENYTPEKYPLPVTIIHTH